MGMGSGAAVQMRRSRRGTSLESEAMFKIDKQKDIRIVGKTGIITISI